MKSLVLYSCCEQSSVLKSYCEHSIVLIAIVNSLVLDRYC